MIETTTRGPMLAHNVFFTLKDASESARVKLVGDCHRYLKGHAGVVFFAAGTVVDDLARDVNDRDFDVGLHVVFASREAHDEYQSSDSHRRFIEGNKENWARVRVFDSSVR